MPPPPSSRPDTVIALADAAALNFADEYEAALGYLHAMQPV
jgi:hypothetical protein